MATVFWSFCRASPGKTAFTLPEGFAPQGRRVLLHFGAVDQVAQVWVNGAPVVRHEGGYLPFCADVTDVLVPGANRLEVKAVDTLSHDPPGRWRWRWSWCRGRGPPGSTAGAGAPPDGGVLDQGYFQDGLFLPRDPEEYDRDILRMKALGFNTLRKHVNFPGLVPSSTRLLK